MIVLLPLILIFILSVVLAHRSMKDLQTPHEITRMIAKKKVRGTVLFTKGKVRHYSSLSSSSDSSAE